MWAHLSLLCGARELAILCLNLPSLGGAVGLGFMVLVCKLLPGAAPSHREPCRRTVCHTRASLAPVAGLLRGGRGGCLLLEPGSPGQS